MGIHSKQGFTIVETMLVLAITGVLIAGLLVGLGSSISNQRYLDAVSTFKSTLQDQYSQVDNVTNDRDANWSCDANATPVVSGNGGGVAPGQSNCVLLGRYVSVVNDQITSATVVGYPSSDTASAADIASLKADYTLGISTSSIETTQLEWGASIAWPKSGAEAQNPTTPRSIAILMIRSPENGTAFTFTSDSVNDINSVSSGTLMAMLQPTLTATPGQAPRTICIDPGGFNVPEKLAVYVGAGATGPGSIEVRSRAVTEAAGGDSQC
jgi:prepilin-type N-terminal cleavage/methylation domain-containing protein